MSTHLSPRLLERLSIDDVRPEERAEAEVHLSSCAACRGEIEASLLLQRSDLVQHPVPAFVARVEARRARSSRLRWPWLSAAGTLLAATAVLLVWLRPVDDLRTKGAGVNVFVRHGGAVRALGANDGIAAGDELQVVLPPGKGEPVWGWVVDEAGAIEALTPNSPVTSSARDTPLPFAATIDAPCRDLWLILARDRVRSDEELRRIAHEHATTDPTLRLRVLRCR